MKLYFFERETLRYVPAINVWVLMMIMSFIAAVAYVIGRHGNEKIDNDPKDKVIFKTEIVYDTIHPVTIVNGTYYNVGENAMTADGSSISDHKIFAGDSFTYASKDFLEECWDFDGIFCGDIHRKFFEKDEFDRFICNTGPMLRTSVDAYNYEHKPSLALFDTNSLSIEFVEIPHKPAEKVLDRTKLDFKNSLKKLSESIKEDIKIDADTFSKSVNLYSVLDSLYSEFNIADEMKEFINNSLTTQGGDV